MSIDVELLSENELVELEQQVALRLRDLEAGRTPIEMRHFKVGESVSFEPPGRQKQACKVIRFYKRTVMILTESGQKWKVAPHLLKKIKLMQPKTRRLGKVIDIPFS